MATSRILLISDTTDDAVASALAGPNHVLTRVPDLDAVAVAGGESEVVVLDIEGATARLVEAYRTIRATESLAIVPILAVSRTDNVEERIDLLEAGVDDVIVRPFDPRELDARVEALVLRYQRSRGLSGGNGGSPVIRDRDPGQQRLVAMFSPKGGVGTTTVAVNVATALATRSPDRVSILDLDLQFGQVATHLNIAPRQTVADLARDDVALRDPSAFQSYLDRHGSSLAVLAAPLTPDGAGSITDATVLQILDSAMRAYTTVVVDAGSVLDPRSEAVLTRATDIVIVVTPEFPALKAVHALRELLNVGPDQVAETSFILNEIFAREILRPRDIEDALDAKIALTVPYDAFAFLKSVNEGVPVVLGAPRSAAAVQLSRLAARLAGVEDVAATVDRRPKGLGALFGRG